MTLGKDSFWYWYFEIAADSDLPYGWDNQDLKFIDDTVLKMQVEEQREELEEYFELACEIAE